MEREIIRILSVIEFHPLIMAFHLGLMLVGVSLLSYSVFSIIIKKVDIMFQLLTGFMVYLMSLILLILILLLETYRFLIVNGKILVKNSLLRKNRFEFNLRDKNLIIGFYDKPFLAKFAIIYGDRLLFKFLTRQKNIALIKNFVLKSSYRMGGTYKICSFCGSINEENAEYCDFCGSIELSPYDLYWID
ncbi:zinc ribbon domain-containing protein [Saccharolobus islandicus]|uniref:Zinc-ribbon domain-containing protein n=1 Tax=Saccharolobus islandicus LAL14/1 TaxID=1241935 RepID=M9UC50_SACIS|nr:zinc ribbon domain-containing protein [Sulfolobus islandicus]AGJ63712.1 Hypothetical Protein SiL_2276 [Sulfolobus islandicus LAL14/1]